MLFESRRFFFTLWYTQTKAGIPGRQWHKKHALILLFFQALETVFMATVDQVVATNALSS